MQYVAQTPQYEGSQYAVGPAEQFQQYGGDPYAAAMYGGGNEYQAAAGMGGMTRPPKYNTTAVYSGESDREGMLLLQNTTKKAVWQPRFVIVKENYLFLFKRSPLLLMRRKYPRPLSFLFNFLRKLRQEKILKVISLEHAEIEIAESATMRPNTFVVHHKDVNTMGKWFFAYFLAADSRAEMEDWIKFLKEQKTSHLRKRVSQVEAIYSSQLHTVTKELYEAEKEKLKIAEELIETENDLFKAMKEEIECLDAEIEHAKRIKPAEPPSRGPPPPRPSSSALENIAKSSKVKPPPLPREAEEAIAIPEFEEEDEETTSDEELALGEGISNQIVVYEDEIEDDYIVGEVIITAEDTVDDLRERVEEELEMEDGFLMMLNDHDLLSTTSTHKVYKYLEADNILVLKY